MSKPTPITGIDNVIFDLGGVVIDLDRDRAVSELEKLGLAQAGDLLNQYCQRGPFLDLESGRITAAQLYDNLRRTIANNGRPAPTDLQLQEAFNAFLVRIPVERLTALLDLRKRGRRVFALSNTNPVMYDSWIRDEFMQQGLTINDYFEGIVASFMEGCCKPDTEIFRRPLTRYSLEPSRTLYLDDSLANCEAAATTGMKVAHVGYSSRDDMLAILDRLQ